MKRRRIKYRNKKEDRKIEIGRRKTRKTKE